ncbi:hypothetical protein GE061_001921 [Apolygus lucorum]|uniref:GP-PDE domain-containing protein n=1 Tax=Apolygus lucorum TaxID=248454 RepID=A0A6A4IWE7_APOLU|nr:hypothetical protein GE061_001921 [Apolygus lucorum]
MMRWWDNDVFNKRRTKSEDEVLRMREELIREEDRKISNDNRGLRQFTFRVEAKTDRLERVGVSGNCPELGNWIPENIVLLDREGTTDIWSKNLLLPLYTEDYIKYRYVVVTDENYNEEDVSKGPTVPTVKSIRRWEANRTVRKLPPILNTLQASASFRKEYLYMSVEAIREARREKTGPPVPDTFGLVDDSNVVSMGWLTSENALELKLFHKDLRLFDKVHSKKPIFIKLRTIRVGDGTEDYCEDPFEGWPVVEVSGQSESLRKFRRQEHYGVRWCSNDNLIFLVWHDNSQTLGILIDFYVYSRPRGNSSDDLGKPHHTGVACLHPCTIADSEGVVQTDIFDIKGNTVGEITLRYVLIKYVKQIKYRMNHSLASLWASMWSSTSRSSLNVIRTCSEIRDNTTASVEATTAEGFNFVEISIQYTKDNLPIFSHSAYLVVALKTSIDITPSEQFQIAVNKCTLSQLHRLRILPVDQCDHILKLKNKKYPLDDKNQPFPTLMQLLNNVSKQVGFIIEVNMMLLREDGTYKEFHHFDVNDNLDKLLKALQQSAGRRNIILASFHPDVCTMMRLKQNTYPVIFLLDGMPDKYPRYDRDVRCRDLDSAIHFAVSLELHGLGLNEETILDPENIENLQKANLVLYCLHVDSERDELVRDYMTKHKLDGILCKRFDEYGRFRRSFGYTLSVKGNERKQIMEWAEEAEKDGYAKPDIHPLEHTFDTVSTLERLINIPPHQISPGLSKYETTPMVITKTDEETTNMMSEDNIVPKNINK